MSKAIEKVEKTEWRWTDERVEAAQMVVDGHTDQAIADKLGVHKNTVYNWRHRPEFAAKCNDLLRDIAARTRLRRIREQSIITDALSTKLAQAIAKDDLNKVNAYGREYHAFRNEERTDFGENVQRIQSKVLVEGGLDHNVTHSGAVGFRDFLDKHVDVIDVTPVIEAAKESPKKALVEMTAQVLQHSDLLDQIHEEDKQAQHAEANSHE